MDKTEVLNILYKYSLEYKEKLEFKNILFVFGEINKPEYFETVFMGRNFLQLTGVIPTENKFVSNLDFYRACIDKNLTENDFELEEDAEIKLLALPQLVNIYDSAKMVCNINFNTTSLIVNKLRGGNITTYIKFVRDDKYFMPNTVVEEDILNLVDSPLQRIFAIFTKKLGENTYTEITYKANGISVYDIDSSKSLGKMVDFNSIKSAM